MDKIYQSWALHKLHSYSLVFIIYTLITFQKGYRLTLITETPFKLLYICSCHHHHHHLSLNHEGHWGTTDDFVTSFLHFSLFSIALWDLANSWPVHSLMSSFYLFLICLGIYFKKCKMLLFHSAWCDCQAFQALLFFPHHPNSELNHVVFVFVFQTVSSTISWK